MLDNFTAYKTIIAGNGNIASFCLAAGKIGWRIRFNDKNIVGLFGGIDNAFDVTYSLGNDINAAGGRYYNVAAGRNYYSGFAWSMY